jgi:hypothetical protein
VGVWVGECGPDLRGVPWLIPMNLEGLLDSKTTLFRSELNNPYSSYL